MILAIIFGRLRTCWLSSTLCVITATSSHCWVYLKILSPLVSIWRRSYWSSSWSNTLYLGLCTRPSLSIIRNRCSSLSSHRCVLSLDQLRFCNWLRSQLWSYLRILFLTNPLRSLWKYLWNIIKTLLSFNWNSYRHHFSICWLNIKFFWFIPILRFIFWFILCISFWNILHTKHLFCLLNRGNIDNLTY